MSAVESRAVRGRGAAADALVEPADRRGARCLGCPLGDARSAAESLGINTELLDGLRAAVAAADPELLLEEYERLLVGPGRAPCAPYESLWHADTREQAR